MPHDLSQRGHFRLELVDTPVDADVSHACSFCLMECDADLGAVAPSYVSVKALPLDRNVQIQKIRNDMGRSELQARTGIRNIAHHALDRGQVAVKIDKTAKEHSVLPRCVRIFDHWSIARSCVPKSAEQLSLSSEAKATRCGRHK